MVRTVDTWESEIQYQNLIASDTPSDILKHFNDIFLSLYPDLKTFSHQKLSDIRTKTIDSLITQKVLTNESNPHFRRKKLSPSEIVEFIRILTINHIVHKTSLLDLVYKNSAHSWEHICFGERHHTIHIWNPNTKEYNDATPHIDAQGTIAKQESIWNHWAFQQSKPIEIILKERQKAIAKLKTLGFQSLDETGFVFDRNITEKDLSNAHMYLAQLSGINKALLIFKKENKDITNTDSPQ